MFRFNLEANRAKTYNIFFTLLLLRPPLGLLK